MNLRIALVSATVVALVAPSVAAARLFAHVGPGTSIALKRANGTLVTHLSPGTRTIVIRDRASGHNFHLTGFGVDKRTGVAFVGRRTWTVQLSAGHTYTYLCDVHPTTMRRTFTVG
jgi:plastocyanin